jgi:hypothetical protein
MLIKYTNINKNYIKMIYDFNFLYSHPLFFIIVDVNYKN